MTNVCQPSTNHIVDKRYRCDKCTSAGIQCAVRQTRHHACAQCSSGHKPCSWADPKHATNLDALLPAFEDDMKHRHIPANLRTLHGIDRVWVNAVIRRSQHLRARAELLCHQYKLEQEIYLQNMNTCQGIIEDSISTHAYFLSQWNSLYRDYVEVHGL